MVRRSVAVRASEGEWQHGSNDCSGKESECSECGECNDIFRNKASQKRNPAIEIM